MSVAVLVIVAVVRDTEQWTLLGRISVVALGALLVVVSVWRAYRSFGPRAAVIAGSVWMAAASLGLVVWALFRVIDRI